MPLQNRVTPTGEIVADLGRGLLMGNRGCLHGPDRRLGVARWRSKLWICCVLDWKGVRRDPMPPGRWTALFFLDEATALAAGHRPCAYCRRADFVAFAEAWRGAHRLAQRPHAAEIDARLHAERVDEPDWRRLLDGYAEPGRLRRLRDRQRRQRSPGGAGCGGGFGGLCGADRADATGAPAGICRSSRSCGGLGACRIDRLDGAHNGCLR